MAAARGRRPRPAAPGDRPAVRRVRAPAGRAADAAAARAGRGARLRPRGPRPGARPASSGPRLGGRPGPFGESPTGTRSRSAWSRSTRCSTTRRCSPPTSSGSGPPVLSAPPPPPAPADAAALPAEVHVPGGPFTMGTSTEPWALDNERPAHEVDVPGVLPGHHAGHQRGLRGVHRRRRLRRPALWTADGWAHRQRAGLTAPLFWRWEGEWVRVAFGGTRAVVAERARAARLLVRGGRLRAVGRAAAAHRGRVGEGGAPGPRQRAGPAATRGATREPTPDAGQPRPAAPAARPGGLPTRPARRPAGRGS